MDPRNVAGQVVRGDDLWGRSQDLSELWRRLDRGSVLLNAPRRHGKTSMMFALRDRPEPGWEVVYINVEYVADPAEFANEFVAAVLAQRGGAALVERVRRVPGTLQRWFGGLFEEVSAGVPDVAEIKLRLREQVAELARDGKVDPGRLLTRLESDWYIECEGDNIRFADGFVRTWWRRNAPMGRAW